MPEMKSLRRSFLSLYIDVEDIPEGASIPVGTLSIVPDSPDPHIPEFTLMLEGQMLPRADYPELSTIYSDGGSFYEFQLPNLRKKFIFGFMGDGEIIYGSAIVYYKTVPVVEERVRDIR